MSEKELLLEISRVSHSSTTVDEALERTQLLLQKSVLQKEAGSAAFFIRPVQMGASYFNEVQIRDLLDSREHPFRAIYTSNVTVNDEAVAILIACFGLWGSPGDILKRATDHISLQLASLMQRDRSRAFTRQEAA